MGKGIIRARVIDDLYINVINTMPVTTLLSAQIAEW